MLYELDATGPPASDPIYAAALISLNRTGKLSIEESKMWHRRLGHLGDAAIKSIINGYADDGHICEVCIQAKLRRKIIRVPVNEPLHHSS
jgi:hypothetical protein